MALAKRLHRFQSHEVSGLDTTEVSTVTMAELDGGEMATSGKTSQQHGTISVA